MVVVFLLRQIFSIFMVFPIITCAILGFVAYSYYRDFRRRKQKTDDIRRIRIFWRIIFIQLSMSAIMLAVAVIYWETSQALWIIELAFWIQIIMALLSLAIARGIRLFTISVNLLTLPIAVMCWIVCSMAITGRWI